MQFTEEESIQEVNCHTVLRVVLTLGHNYIPTFQLFLTLKNKSILFATLEADFLATFLFNFPFKKR